MPKKLYQSYGSKDRKNILPSFLYLYSSPLYPQSPQIFLAYRSPLLKSLEMQLLYLPTSPHPSFHQLNSLALSLSPPHLSLHGNFHKASSYLYCTKLTAPLNPIGKPILVPLTTSLYVPGELADTENVIVDVGTGFYVEKVQTLFFPIILLLSFIIPLHFTQFRVMYSFSLILEATFTLNFFETYTETLEYQRCNQILRSKS